LARLKIYNASVKRRSIITKLVGYQAAFALSTTLETSKIDPGMKENKILEG
jgi:hypothetical protein